MNIQRRIFIGDVQGCREALERLLDEVRFAPPNDTLYFTGDLVNRGPDSLGVLRLVRDLKAESVLGNHDVHLLEVNAGLVKASDGWTFQDVLQASDRDEILDWLARRPPMLYLGDVVLVHAAIRPGWDDLQQWSMDLQDRGNRLQSSGRSMFEDEDLRFVLSARYCTEKGEQATPDWPTPKPPFQNWSDFYQGEEIVVFGHFARQGLLIRDRIRGLDTGCVHGNSLTAWIAEEDRVVSVKADPR